MATSVSFVRCIAVRDGDLDSNSALSQILGLAQILSALQPREIRLVARGSDPSLGNRPLYSYLAQVRKMPEGYFTDYSDGLVETSEGDYSGSFFSDGDGRFELVLEEGLGTYRVDFYNLSDSLPEPEYVHSQLIRIDSYKSSLAGLVVSEVSGNLKAFEWEKVQSFPRKPYALYNVATDENIQFIGEKNGRSFYTGKIVYPKDLEIQTQPNFQLKKYILHNFLAYTDNGLDWDSIVIFEAAMDMEDSQEISFCNYFLLEDELKGFLKKEVAPGVLKIYRVNVPIANPKNYTVDEFSYNPTVPNFAGLYLSSDYSSFYGGKLLYSESDTFDDLKYVYSGDFLSTVSTPVNDTDSSSPFRFDNSVSKLSIHNGLFGGANSLADTIFLMGNDYSSFHFIPISRTVSPIGPAECWINSRIQFCMESTNTPMQSKVYAGNQLLTLSSGAFTIDNSVSKSWIIAAQMLFYGSLESPNFTILSFRDAITEEDHWVRITHDNAISQEIPMPPRFLSNSYIINGDSQVVDGYGIHKGDILSLTKESNVFPGFPINESQTQHYLTSSRSSDGVNWTPPRKVDIRPPRKSN